MLRPSPWSIVLLTLVIPLPLSAAQEPAPAAGIDANVTHALQAREYERAVRLIDAGLGVPMVVARRPRR